MIAIIGARRLTLLMILLVMNGVIAASLYLYIMPEKTKSAQNLSVLKGRTSTLQSDIDRMQLEFEQLGQQQEAFDNLKKDGFFNAQERSIAKDIFKKIQTESKVIAAVANIKSGYLDQNPEALKAKHVVLVSPVEIAIKAFDDTDIYRYIYLAEKTFPGHLSLESIVIERTRDVSAPVLRAIATGANPELVNAKITMLWKTMVPEPAVDGEGGVQQ